MRLIVSATPEGEFQASETPVALRRAATAAAVGSGARDGGRPREPPGASGSRDAAVVSVGQVGARCARRRVLQCLGDGVGALGLRRDLLLVGFVLRVVARREVVEEHARPVATRAIRKFVGDEAANLGAALALGEPTGGEVHGRVVVRLEVRAERLGCPEDLGADGAREGLARWVGVGAAGGLRPPRLPRLASLHALSSDVLVGRFLVVIVATVRRRGLAPVAALEALGDGPLIHVDVALRGGLTRRGLEVLWRRRKAVLEGCTDVCRIGFGAVARLGDGGFPVGRVCQNLYELFASDS